MVVKKRVLCIICIIFLCFYIPAEEKASTAESSAALFSFEDEQNGFVGYSFVMDAQGNPVYSQELSWERDPYALAYDVTVLDNNGAEIINTRQEEPSLALNLSPGDYSYNIITINLLEQAEAETGFQPLLILRAEIPEIYSVSPGFIFMDSFNSLVTIQGVDLQEGSRIVLRRRGNTTEHGIEGVEQSRQGESTIVVEFPSKAYVPGTFEIAIVNPGGLFAKKANALRIMYQRPLDILFSVGYSPVALMHDSWFKEVWNEPIYLLGADSSLSVYFLKKAWGFLGIGIDISAHRMTGGIEMAKISSDYLLPSLNLLYKLRINKMFHLLARGGAGIHVAHHSFDYEGEKGPDDYFSSVSAQGGLAVQCFLPHKMYIELGADWVELFTEKNVAGLIRPTLRFGYQLF